MTPRKTSSESPAIRPRAQRPSRSARPERERSARDDGAEKERCPLGVALPLAREIERQLQALVGAGGARIAGSVRRRRETVGDLNFVAAARRPAAAFGAFASLPEVAQIRGRGHARIRVRLHGGMDADLNVVPEASLGAALICFTGSSAHHRALRRVAHRRKLELNEYGLFRGERMMAGRTEADIYRALGLAFVPPELREDAGEIAAARDSVLPPLIEHGDLRGDLRVYVDARRPAAIAAVACVARAAGLEYLALTCAHAANVVEHVRAVRALRRAWPGLRLLAGAEVAIRRDGSLELDGAVLAGLDVVTAVIRDHRDQPRDQMTRRIVRAMENPHVDLIVHPASRSAAFDLDAVIAAAKRTATVLAVDTGPDPIALRGDDVRRVLDAGVRIAIDSAASEPGQLALASEFGIALARRGWARRCDVINALPVWQCLCQLKTGRRRDPARPVVTDYEQWDEPPQTLPASPTGSRPDAAGCGAGSSCGGTRHAVALHGSKGERDHAAALAPPRAVPRAGPSGRRGSHPGAGARSHRPDRRAHQRADHGSSPPRSPGGAHHL